MNKSGNAASICAETVPVEAFVVKARKMNLNSTQRLAASYYGFALRQFRNGHRVPDLAKLADAFDRVCPST